jgi:hypothetical protein
MENMDRVLALQSLAEIAPVDGGAADSNLSTGCSSQSSGTGKSSCSMNCDSAENMEW